MAQATDPSETAGLYSELFPAVYLLLHRRDAKRSELSGASRAVLMHLAQAGPLTIGECAKHLERTQSVVSEIVDQLEKNGLLARVRDEQDRRRTLVWLSERGRERIAGDQEVLSRDAVEHAVRAMKPEERKMLIEGTRALVRAAESLRLSGRYPSKRSRK